jgi:uncharacterized Zn finger protein
MNCPKCDGQTKVNDVVKAKNENYRRILCKSCGHVFFTVEYETENNESFRNNWNRNNRRYKKEMQK